MCIPFPLLLRPILGPCPKSSAPDSQGNPRISPSQSGQIPGKQAVFSLVVPGWRRQYIQAILGHSRRQWSLRALPRQMSKPVGKTIPRQRAGGQWGQVELWQVLSPELPTPAGTANDALTHFIPRQAREFLRARTTSDYKANLAPAMQPWSHNTMSTEVARARA